MQCFHALNGIGIGNAILRRDNKGYFSYKGTLISFFFVRELVNSVVKSSTRTHSSERDLSKNDWINKNLQNTLNRKVIFCFLTSVLSLQFLYLLTSLPAHLMSCEFSLCFKLRYNINKKCLGFFPSQKRRLMGMTKWNMCKVDITNMVCDCSLVSQEQTRRQPTGCRIQQWYMGLSYSVWDCGEISRCLLIQVGWTSARVIWCKKIQSDCVTQELR